MCFWFKIGRPQSSNTIILILNYTSYNLTNERLFMLKIIIFFFHQFWKKMGIHIATGILWLCALVPKSSARLPLETSKFLKKDCVFSSYQNDNDCSYYMQTSDFNFDFVFAIGILFCIMAVWNINSTGIGEAAYSALQAINAVLIPETRDFCSLLLFRDPLTASDISLVSISVVVNC